MQMVFIISTVVYDVGILNHYGVSYFCIIILYVHYLFPLDTLM